MEANAALPMLCIEEALGSDSFAAEDLGLPRQAMLLRPAAADARRRLVEGHEGVHASTCHEPMELLVRHRLPRRGLHVHARVGFAKVLHTTRVEPEGRRRNLCARSHPTQMRMK